jgi:hypothetical protein
MSPLARLRQVATCLVFASIVRRSVVAGRSLLLGLSLSVGLALAADPAPQSNQPAAAASATSPAASPAASSAPTVPSSPSMPTAAAAPSDRPTQSPQPVQLAPNVVAPIAHSALLTIEGTATADALQLSIRRVSDKSLLSSDDVTVAVDGKNQSVTHQKGGAYELPINDLRGEGARDVDVTVAHDGIREIVSAKVSVAEASSAGSLFRDHKQVAWWILNIVIVLVAAMAFSRRKG